MRRMWHIWPGQLWPMLPEQEAQFVDELSSRAGSPSRFDRDDVTAVLGILRCGAPLAKALELAPGLRLPALLGAYRRLSDRLAAASAAWQAIEADPTPMTLLRNAELAALLLPVPVHRAVYAMEESADVLATVVGDLSATVAATVRAAEAFEFELRQHAHPSTGGAVLGARLHSPSEPGVYADPFYLPGRVAALSPVRVGDLLGEPRSN